MSSRERTLIWIMGIALSAAVLYLFVGVLILPLLEKSSSNRKIEGENLAKESELDGRQFQNTTDMAKILPRSLPADLDLGKQEYDRALGRLLAEAKVPAGYTLKEIKAESKDIPELVKGRLAYTKIAFTVSMDKVDIGTLMVFLKKYYELNLLHQITKINIKREEATKVDSDKRQPKDRTDLKVTLTTEAIMLDGAPARKTLLAAPISGGSVLGAAGFYSMENTIPDIGRGFSPYSLVQILATPERDYALVPQRDALHGELPPLPPPKPIEKEKPPVEVPPGPDIGAYIRLVSIVTTSDGSAHVELFDVWNNFDFEINLKQRGEKLSVASIRYKKEKPSDKNPNGRVIDKTYPEGGMLAFADDKSRTKHLFKIYGIDGSALILGEIEGATEVAKPAGGGGKVGGGKTAPKPVKQDEGKMAFLGALFAAVPPPKVEKFYRWEVGVPLKSIKELKPEEAQKAIQRALGGLLEVSSGPMVAPTPKPEVPPVGREIAPLPKAVIDEGK